MDWARAVDINRIALTRVVAEIFALVGGGRLERLHQALYVAATRLLRPAESALRRLIIIAARGLGVKPSVSRPFPKGIVIKASTSEKISFPLFDARKSFDFGEPDNPLFVMVKTYSKNPYNPFELNQWRQPESAPRDYARSLSRRLAAVKQALETLPRQASRMARWLAKHKAMNSPKFKSPLRPGHPPGHRGKPNLEIDLVLTECHALAWDVLCENSS